MGAKDKKEKEGEEIKPAPEAVEKTKEKIDEKIQEVEKKAETATGERQNIIGEINKPDPSKPDEVKEFFKKLDQKLDRILELHSKKEEPKKEESKTTTEVQPPATAPKKVAWYDRELF